MRCSYESKACPRPGTEIVDSSLFHPFGRSVELVICYCSERLSWLSAFVQLPWRDEDRSKAVKQVALSFYHKRLGANGWRHTFEVWGAE